MFFFLRPNFKLDGFWATHIPFKVLFFLFPLATISVDLWTNEMENDSFWIDED